MGAAFSLLNPSLMLIAVDRVSESARGAAMGTFTAFFDAGVGIGAPLAGLAAALTDYEGAFVLAAAIAVGSAVLILDHPAPAPAVEPASAGRRAASAGRGRSGRARRRGPTRRCRRRWAAAASRASTQIHSPAGIRSRWTVRSTLMKRKRR